MALRNGLIHIEGLTQRGQQQIRFNNEFKEELVQVLTELGEHIHEMKSGIAEVRTAQNEATSKLIEEMQAKQSPPEIKVAKFYLLDLKRWAEWVMGHSNSESYLCHHLGNASLRNQSIP